MILQLAFNSGFVGMSGRNPSWKSLRHINSWREEKKLSFFFWVQKFQFPLPHPLSTHPLSLESIQERGKGLPHSVLIWILVSFEIMLSPAFQRHNPHQPSMSRWIHEMWPRRKGKGKRESGKGKGEGERVVRAWLSKSSLLLLHTSSSHRSVPSLSYSELESVDLSESWISPLPFWILFLGQGTCDSWNWDLFFNRCQCWFHGLDPKKESEVTMITSPSTSWWIDLDSFLGTNLDPLTHPPMIWLFSSFFFVLTLVFYPLPYLSSFLV